MDIFSIKIFLVLLSAMFALWHTTGFILGQEYDYLARKRTYNGLKAIFWFSVVYGVFHI